ncbi:OmpA family protein [Chitinophaga nivalis]|uniref:OmpA family protein n=1 Tax=Chitinophaga nivalis TaxID=2991709 RepID=A0ABT3IR73_9BACT|nr:OmpA family protein [Chitinophaga nivalis]MCW3463823.1 OmpA family protein [Chitinophaga nivalis]MCW3486487.1 OmpA family protein [Chitinophaga nivalis]
MNKSIIQRAVCVFLAALPMITKAQDQSSVSASPSVKLFNGTRAYKTWSIGVNGGLLAPVAATGGSNDFSKWKVSAGYGGYVKYQLLPFMALRADYVGGKLQADNSKELGDGTLPVSPYKSYETKLQWSGTLNAVFNIATVNWLFRQNFVQLYASVGGGIAGYKPTLERKNGTKVDATTNTIKELIIPVGAGLKFKLSEVINLDLGYTMYYTDGDNLDGYEKGPNKDKYSYGYAGLEFSLGKKGKKQLQWHNPAATAYDELEAQKATLRAELDAANQNNARLTADVDKLTKDADGDGVSDFFDKCPGTPANTKVDGAGCPLPVPEKIEEKVVITEEDTRLVKEAIQNLEFEFAKSSIKASSYPSLDRVAELLKRKNLNLKLGGHTDNVGNAKRNLALSRERAESVKNYMISKGVNANKVEAIGYGMTQPIASNKTAAGRQKNRRVEFTIF